MYIFSKQKALLISPCDVVSIEMMHFLAELYVCVEYLAFRARCC